MIFCFEILNFDEFAEFVEVALNSPEKKNAALHFAGLFCFGE